MTWGLSVLCLAVDTTYNRFCCFSYTSCRVLQKVIVDYFPTNHNCFNPGVIFLTKKGRHICANPSKEWVKKYTKHLNASGAAEAVRTQ
ncbi:C-C motif chemokine 3-like [Sapajus apella]|uniref:C-C motif chemokine n=1 Tax=Sapajus apella TaxID=9515 RepID=A0A6J3I340_SAPAP|nr:C-C motif chemokine 3-like [Sapajus apella]